MLSGGLEIRDPCRYEMYTSNKRFLALPYLPSSLEFLLPRAQWGKETQKRYDPYLLVEEDFTRHNTETAFITELGPNRTPPTIRAL